MALTAQRPSTTPRGGCSCHSGHQPRKAADAAALVELVASTKGVIALAPADVELKGVKGVKTLEIK
jgi:hypothetical protein